MKKLMSIGSICVTVFVLLATNPASVGQIDSRQGFILKAGDGEVVFDGLASIKVSPDNADTRNIMVESTHRKGESTILHYHEQGDELFYVVKGRGTATVGDVTQPIGPGDVIFVGKGVIHKYGNLDHEEPLIVVFFMDSPELVEQFRAIHKRKTSEPDLPITEEERLEMEQRFGGSIEVKGEKGKQTAQQGPSEAYVLKAGDGEKVRGGSVVVVADPMTGSYDSSMFVQTMAPKTATSIHSHLKADEYFFVHEGSGAVFLGSKQIPISKGDVIFIPKGTEHRIESSNSGETLEVVFVMNRPGLEGFFREKDEASQQAEPRKLTLEEVDAIARKYGDTISELGK